MMHDPILHTPGERPSWLDWRIGLVALAGVATGAVMLWLTSDWRFAIGFLATIAALAALALLLTRRFSEIRWSDPEPDIAILHDALEAVPAAAAITDRSGRLVVANARYAALFESSPAPQQIERTGAFADALDSASRAAWRDGSARVSAMSTNGAVEVLVTRSGVAADHLLWRFDAPEQVDALAGARDLVAGPRGEVLDRAGIGAALVDEGGKLLASSGAISRRNAAGESDFAALLAQGEDGRVRYLADGPAGVSLRLVQLPADAAAPESASLFFLIEESAAAAGPAVSLQALLEILPLGLALADREGRFLFLNDAFRAAAGIGAGDRPVYPGDLVVKEDKGAVADAVRRFARGAALNQPMAGDLAVRLKHQSADPVALTIAGTRGLGDAAALLLLKDNSEEVKLKAQVAQATKMQAVGQLAGGVAHDFNNILTAIIGHCDLMLMRHTPGDSDYDDIQQVKNNSNRAAALTRQLLAFSRQQTLRPQVLQLPDVVSEVSHLLKRLLGDEVRLVVKHGRSLGAVRADPGQLEQVIINLAVNARDAMAGKDEVGTLTIQTYPVSAEKVRDIGTDILPVADYTALRVTDTGSGIPDGVLAKIFEPFFTTKEVGKGTGLGLSTVYGIVKQSGGFIFADSKVGRGTSFTIYLPVHEAEEAVRAPAQKSAEELWGTGTVLLVEDEATVRAVAERALTRQGYSVLTAANGEEALEILARGEPVDLLVSDVVMPMMDGPTMVREARRTRPDLPILFMSGYAEEQLRKSISIDNVAFLPKPFSVQQLAQAAKSALMSR